MADTKLSGEPAASALDGTELIDGVQGGGNVKITTAQAKTFTSASPTLVTPNIGAATGTTLALSTLSFGTVFTGTVATTAGNHMYIDVPNGFSHIFTHNGTGIIKWTMNGSGHFLAGTDNVFDIGAAGATRPRTGYFGTSVSSPTYVVTSGNINAQTGTTYTLVASDNGKVVTLSNASAITLTVPASLGAGFCCTLIQIGAGQVTIAASSTTIHPAIASADKIANQYGVASLYAYAADVFSLAGTITA